MTDQTTSASRGKLSELASKMDESDFDRMIERGSVPNLATLFQRGKEAGLITPVTVYGTAAGGA